MDLWLTELKFIISGHCWQRPLTHTAFWEKPQTELSASWAMPLPVYSIWVHLCREALILSFHQWTATSPIQSEEELPHLEQLPQHFCSSGLETAHLTPRDSWWETDMPGRAHSFRMLLTSHKYIRKTIKMSWILDSQLEFDHVRPWLLCHHQRTVVLVGGKIPAWVFSPWNACLWCSNLSFRLFYNN